PAAAGPRGTPSAPSASRETFSIFDFRLLIGGGTVCPAGENRSPGNPSDIDRGTAHAPAGRPLAPVPRSGRHRGGRAAAPRAVLHTADAQLPRAVVPRAGADHVRPLPPGGRAVPGRGLTGRRRRR